MTNTDGRPSLPSGQHKENRTTEPYAAFPIVGRIGYKQATDTLYISAITVLEIQRDIGLAAQRGDAAQSAVFTRWLESQDLPAFNGRILPADHVVARKAAQLPWPDPRDYRDALIAATGLVHGAAVVTRNIKDFESCGVAVLNPWTLQ